MCCGIKVWLLVVHPMLFDWEANVVKANVTIRMWYNMDCNTTTTITAQRLFLTVPFWSQGFCVSCFLKAHPPTTFALLIFDQSWFLGPLQGGRVISVIQISQATKWVRSAVRRLSRYAVCCGAIMSLCSYGIYGCGRFTALLSQRCLSAGGLQNEATHIHTHECSHAYVFVYLRPRALCASRRVIEFHPWHSYSLDFYMGSHKLSRLCDQHKRC